MTKTQLTKNMRNNGPVDLMMMGAAIFLFMGALFKGSLAYIEATQPANYIGAGVFTIFALYCVLAPIFRNK